MTTLNEAIAYVRMRLGNPDATEVPDLTISTMINFNALGWLNRRKPKKTIAYFMTVTGQQDYDIMPAGAYEIINCWWMDTDFEYFSPGMRVMPMEQNLNFQLAGFNAFDYPSAVEDFYKKVSAYSGNFKGRWEVTNDDKLRLIPFPGNSQDKVYFEYSSPLYAGVSNVSIKDIEGLICYACYEILNYLIIKRGMVRGGKNFSAGGGENEKEMAKTFLERAEGEIPVSGSYFSRG